MTRVCPPILFSSLLFLTLVGCAGSAINHNSILLQASADSPGFPPGYEIQASLRISQKAVQEDYLLAMTTASETLSAAFLTPQGIPVYTVSLARGELQVTRQAAMGKLLEPVQMLRYLALIYLQDRNIEALIRANWQWESPAGERLFHLRNEPDTPSASVSIRYGSAGPWYSPVLLADTRNDTQLTVHILEASIVLPE